MTECETGDKWECDLGEKCEKHHGKVNCDKDCRALLEPTNFDEATKAAEHWQDHEYLGGCSHGC